MSYGCEAWDEEGNSIITEYAPYGIVGVVPLTSAGVKTLTIPDGTGSLEHWVQYGNYRVTTNDNKFLVQDVSLTGNVISYTVVETTIPFTSRGIVYFVMRR